MTRLLSTTSAADSANLANSDAGGRRVRGLDTLRFFLALWVVFGHLDFLPLTAPDGGNPLGRIGRLIDSGLGILFSGPAAVIVFFVISGFCIHYPFRNGKELRLIPYFSRRHLRIWIPITVAVLVGNPLGIKLNELQTSILWSLLAEEIYYLIYPALLALRRKEGNWTKILIASYIAAFVVIMLDPREGNYNGHGPYVTWILGLPCWLLGCLLAEKINTLATSTVISPFSIWKWRFAALTLSSLCLVLRFHSPVKYPWTLTLFAIFAYFWLEKEIIYFFHHKPVPLFENAGKGSYSIYLVHLLGPALYTYLSLPVFGATLTWFIQIGFTLALCYVFYALVEKPSHNLARRVAEKLSPKTADAPVPQAA